MKKLFNGKRNYSMIEEHMKNFFNGRRNYMQILSRKH